jgi:hypothetical protein
MAPAGRPRLGKETKERYNVMLEPAIAKWLRQHGEDNLSAGIQKLAAKAMLKEAFEPAQKAGQFYLKVKRARKQPSNQTEEEKP